MFTYSEQEGEVFGDHFEPKMWKNYVINKTTKSILALYDPKTAIGKI